MDSVQIKYHQEELAIVQNVGDPRRIIPTYPCSGWKVLDVGCGIGQTLLAHELSPAAELHGIDVNKEAIEYGQAKYPNLVLKHAKAEAIPYPECTFELTFSRVSLPYTNIPVALSEIRRVTKQGGHVWLTLHPWSLELGHVARAIKTFNLKRLVDRVYVCANGLSLSWFGKCIARPWNGRYESVQTDGAIRRALRKAGAVDIITEKGDHHFLVRARIPGPHIPEGLNLRISSRTPELA